MKNLLSKIDIYAILVISLVVLWIYFVFFSGLTLNKKAIGYGKIDSSIGHPMFK